jgi:ribonuclease HI
MTKIIYADGSCSRNGEAKAIGGWNFLILEDMDGQESLVDSVSGSSAPNLNCPNTNIRMEMQAVIEALKYFKEPEDFRIHSDSAYVVNGINKKWYVRWFLTGKNTLGKVPANMDLWKKLVTLVKFHKSVEMVHVKGHSGHKWQEISDTFARQASVGV